MDQLQAKLGQFTELGYQIIAISPDLPEKIQQLITIKKLDFPLLSDSKKIAAKAFGIAFKLSDELNKKYQSKDIYIDDASGETDHVLPVPSVFIIMKDGTIKFEYINPDYAVRIDTDVVLQAARSIKEKKM